MKTPNRLENPAKKKNAFGLEVKRHWQLYVMAAPLETLCQTGCYNSLLGFQAS